MTLNDKMEPMQTSAETDEQVSSRRKQPDPSFLLRAANEQPRDLLIERYRRTLGLAGEPLPVYGSASQRPEYWQHPLAAGRSKRPPFMDKTASARNQAPTRGAKQRLSPPSGQGKYYATAMVLAVVLGGAAGYAASHFDTIKSQLGAAYLAMMPVQENVPPTMAAENDTSPPTDIVKKTIAMATLEVSDVAGRVNSLIPLALKATPAEEKQDLLLKLSGLPDKAYLTAGRRDANKDWALTLKDLADVKVMVPAIGTPKIDISVAAVERQTGELAAPVKTMTIALADATVEPASAPPPLQTAAPAKDLQATEASPIPRPDSTGLVLTAKDQAVENVANGEALLKSGDVEAARQQFAKAWTGGAAEAALGMARTYDPLVYAELSITGSTPDRAQAIAWYERAAAAGQEKAMLAIVRLRVKP